MMRAVNVNEDMAKYLPDSSEMKKGTDIIKEEFPNSTEQSRLRIMVQDLSEEEKPIIAAKLRTVQNIETVEFQAGSEYYNKDNHTLFVATSSYDYDSKEFEQIKDTIKTDILSGYDVFYATDKTPKAGLPIYIVAGAVAILMVILFLMTDSWIEPFLFLISIGLSILINMGTNMFLPSVSLTTHSITAILQLVLAMDYSIILSNRYRQARKKIQDDAATAMRQAIASAIPSVCSSSLTTIVGLLSLCFMRFKIGMDLGVVLAKGVFLSLLCVFTVLPGLLILFDKLIHKTVKKSLVIPITGLARFEYKVRFGAAILFLLIFAGAFAVRNKAGISYGNMYPKDDVSDVFPRNNQIVLLYNNEDESKMASLAETAGQKNGVTSVSTYANTLGGKMDTAEMYAYISGMLSSMGAGENSGLLGGFPLDESMVRFLYYDRFSDRTDELMSLEEFIGFVNQAILSQPFFVEQLDEASVQALQEAGTLCSRDALTEERSADEISELLGVDKTVVKLLMKYLGTDTLSITELLDALDRPEVSAALALTGGLSKEDEEELAFYRGIVSSIMDEEKYSAGDMAGMLSAFSANGSGDETAVDETTSKYTALVYELYFSGVRLDPTWRMSIDEVFDHILTSETFSSFIDDDTEKMLKLAQLGIQSGASRMVGPKHSLFVVNTVFGDGDKDAMAFTKELNQLCKDNLTGDYYLIGSTPMAAEMSGSFRGELNKITLITAIAIFIVVLFTFRNVLIPIILVLLIQCSVYITMFVMNVMGVDMHYLALLIVQSLLMGATIDYAIVFTNFYLEKRSDRPIKEALVSTYKASIRTIMTSGLIMVFITWIMGYVFADPSIGQICHIISIGVVSALVMILCFLPAVLSVLDKFICGKKAYSE